jgi:hypothetical protein
VGYQIVEEGRRGSLTVEVQDVREPERSGDHMKIDTLGCYREIAWKLGTRGILWVSAG